MVQSLAQVQVFDLSITERSSSVHRVNSSWSENKSPGRKPPRAREEETRAQGILANV